MVVILTTHDSSRGRKDLVVCHPRGNGDPENKKIDVDVDSRFRGNDNYHEIPRRSDDRRTSLG
jgi:hypothetical protein